MFLFDNKILGKARQSRIGFTYGRKVRTPNEHGTCGELCSTQESASLWKVPQKITALQSFTMPSIAKALDTWPYEAFSEVGAKYE